MNDLRCSQLECARLACWFYEPRYNIRVPLCEDHKTPDSKPLMSIESMDGNDVCPIVIRPKEFFDKCQHNTLVLDDEFHRVECGQCGEVLDAFLCLREIADEFRSLDYKIRARADYERKSREDTQRAKDRAFKRRLKDCNISPKTITGTVSAGI